MGGKMQRPQNRVVPDRERQALELKLAGATYAQIAKQIGYANEGGAYKAVGRALKNSIKERDTLADEVRQMELARLDEMQLGLWPDARKGKWLAIDRVLKIMERRARLLGLDAPVRTEMSGPDGGAIQIEQDVNLTLTPTQRLERLDWLIESESASVSRLVALPGPDLDTTEGAAS